VTQLLLYTRANTPLPLLPSEIREMEADVGKFDREWLDDASGAGFQEVIQYGLDNSDTTLVVYRLEHLSRVEHRATRIRKLGDAGIKLRVFIDWPLSGVILNAVADYTEQLLVTERKERDIRISTTMSAKRARGEKVGRPALCTCDHPQTKRNKTTDEKEDVHLQGTGSCLVYGCPCKKYQSRLTTPEGAMS
jgi:hypothetical protein